MHRLVQMITLHSLTVVEQTNLLNAVIDVLRKGHPQSQATSDTLFKHWDTCAIYAPHVLHLQAFRGKWDLPLRSTERLYEIMFNCSW